MTTTTCQVCKVDTPGPRLCPIHVEFLQTQLDEIPWLLAQLEITLTRQDHLNLGVQGRKSSDTPSPINFGASRLNDEVTALLQRWTAKLVDFDAMEFKPGPAHLAKFLSKSVNQLANIDGIGAFYNEIIGLVGDPNEPDVPGRLVNAINKRAARVFAGPCPGDRGYDREGNPVVCSTPLYAVDQQPDVTCIRCGTVVNVAKNQTRAATDRDLMPEKAVVEWSDVLGEPVTKRHLEVWINQNRLKIHGYLHRGEIVDDKPEYHSPRVVSLSQARALRAQDQMTEVPA